MGEKYRLKENVGKHYLPFEKGKPMVAMKTGDLIDEENIPSAARDKFELASAKAERIKVERVVVNNLVAREESEGKWEVKHKKTGQRVHSDFLTKKEAEELLGEPIVGEKKFSRRKAGSK